MASAKASTTFLGSGLGSIILTYCDLDATEWGESPICLLNVLMAHFHNFVRSRETGRSAHYARSV
jgi:hypothetical protein